MSKEAARPLHIAGGQPQVHDIVVHSAFFILMNDDLFLGSISLMGVFLLKMMRGGSFFPLEVHARTSLHFIIDVLESSLYIIYFFCYLE